MNKFLRHFQKGGVKLGHRIMGQTPKVMKAFYFTLFVMLLYPQLSFSASEDFVGEYCSNPCYYGSVNSVSSKIPCKLKLTNQEIRWVSGRIEFKYRYHSILETKREVVISVKGPSGLWYSEGQDGSEHRITISKDHQFSESKPELFHIQHCIVSNDGCSLRGSMYIRLHDDKCPAP
ncbi:hypothetical protein [Maricurvus nonylphenolicus]|uniref:hypothetical protein n=1 Tax=Maricurvus nonylphenolicus TaxID=1008307 RepID=UPI0036F382B1